MKPKANKMDGRGGGRRLLVSSFCLATLLVAAGACGGSDDGNGADGGGADGGGADGSGADGSGGGTARGGAATGASSSGAAPSAGAGSGTAGGGSVEFPSCANATAGVRIKPLDLALLVDTSFSMDFDGKWTQVSFALKSFAADPAQAGTGLALQFFPLPAQCRVGAYGAPAVPMATLPDAEPSVRAAIDGQRLDGGTPLTQALEGMADYTASYAQANPERTTVLVLATDGIPDESCTSPNLGTVNSISNAAKVAETALAGGLPVFVIGVGQELSELNTLAEAGGTDEAIIIDVGQNVQQAFFAALQKIRQQSLECDYAIPEPESGQTIDFDKVNVQLSTGGDGETFFYAEDRAGCSESPEKSWYYDDPANPTTITLCPLTCSRVSETPGARVDIVFGCARQDIQ